LVTIPFISRPDRRHKKAGLFACYYGVPGMGVVYEAKLLIGEARNRRNITQKAACLKLGGPANLSVCTTVPSLPIKQSWAPGGIESMLLDWVS